MKAMDATVRRLFVSGLVAVGCSGGRAPHAAPPPGDAGTTVTVYVAPPLAERVLGRLQRVAAQHQWALSLRTDGPARAEADLVITDSGGALVGRVRPSSPAAAQARQLADAVGP